MKPITFDKPHTSIEPSQVSSLPSARRPWWLCWEMYILAVIAALLRLYGIQTTEFDDDQVMIFRMAYDALHRHMLIATSNVASIHILNPPGIEYILMLPALLGANVVWAAILLAVLSTAGVLLTYFFTRHYYGRLAATLAASFYAIAALPVFYSRFIWQQNFLLFFVPLFIAILFWGVVSRRQGWFAPALVLFGLLIQLHGSSILLSFVFLAAWILAPRTVRWRDIVLGVFLVLLIYSPYIWWEVSSHFSDVAILRHQLQHTSHLDAQVLKSYEEFLGTHNIPLSPSALFIRIAPYVNWMMHIMAVLLCLAFCWIISDVIGRFKRGATKQSFLESIRHWWSELRANPYRSGLLVLLIWQIAPLLSLLRHSVGTAPFYLLILMPGPFLLIGIFLARCFDWLRQRTPWRLPLRIGLYVLVAMLVIGQCTSSAALVQGMTSGSFQDTQLSRPYYNDWSSLSNAFMQADQLAQRQHLRHIYVLSDMASIKMYSYFTAVTQTPTTVFSGNCAVIPGMQTGPVAMLVTPKNQAGLALLRQFASTTLVSKPQRLGGVPFLLYVVQPAKPLNTTQATFSQDVTLQAAQRTTIDNKPMVVTRWQVLRSTQPDPRVIYTYNITNTSQSAQQTASSSGGNGTSTVRQVCNSTDWQAGDQMVLGFNATPGITAAPALSIAVSASQAQPVIIHLPLPGGHQLSAETVSYDYPSSTLRTEQGQQQVTIRFAPDNAKTK